MGILDIFGINVFNDDVMKERLPNDVYESLKHTIKEGVALDSHIAKTVAEAMKDWAIERGATHYSHWFQP
ncbi:MAG: glutamine synthetase III, partial [Clostridia bacterium]|nr:glutamine synthetase III [Clostridia bacterium]